MTQYDILTYATAAAVLTGWAGLFAYVGLRCWNGWLALKRHEIDMSMRPMVQDGPAQMSAAARIDMADLKERVRKLEAIASGVDL